MKAVDLAWLAGLLEGEGAFFGCRISIQMTDRDIIDRAAKLAEATQKIIVCRSDHPNHKTLYGLRISGHRAIRLMKMLLPHMGVRRTTKINALIAEWESIPRTRERRIPPECHSTRRHYAQGMCAPCYWRMRNVLQRKGGPKERQRKMIPLQFAAA